MAERVNLGLSRPRRRHDSGTRILGALWFQALLQPPFVRPRAVRCLRRAGAAPETGKAARELAGSRFPIGDTVPFPAKRLPTERPGLARPCHRLQDSGPGGSAPRPTRDLGSFLLDAGQPRPSPDFVTPSNSPLLLGEPGGVPPRALVNLESQAGPRMRLPLQPPVCVPGSQSDFSTWAGRVYSIASSPDNSRPRPQHTHTQTQHTRPSVLLSGQFII